MENREFFVDELSFSSLGKEMQSNELNCGSQQLPDCFLNPNWDNSMDQNDPFESALSSIVSSPAPQNAAPMAADSNGLEIQELIGKLGSICESGEVSAPISCVGSNSNSANPSSYNTPISSPTKFSFLANSGRHLPVHPSWAPFPADPGFADRAARFSCFGGGSFSDQNGNLGSTGTEFQCGSVPDMESNQVSELCNKQSLKSGAGSITLHDVNSHSGSRFTQFPKSAMFENAELGNSREESSVSEQIPQECQSMKAKNDVNPRKRKSNPRGKAKEAKSHGKVQTHTIESNAKRIKEDEASGKENGANEQNAESSGDAKQNQEKEDSKQPEPPKDYIHVRARRGQATDAHSLAERVRRERISERMNFLQDLVPGCNKVTGKAVMLDEIINYVQSLQRQVEFLSMKLATMNPRMNFDIEALLSKDIFQSGGSFLQTTHPLSFPERVFSTGHQPQTMSSRQSCISSKVDQQLLINPMPGAFCTNSSIQVDAISNFAGSAPQVASSLWEDDLRSVVEMRSSQYQTGSCHGLMAADHMNVDL